jgi:hypothetical protein
MFCRTPAVSCWEENIQKIVREELEVFATTTLRKELDSLRKTIVQGGEASREITGHRDANMEQRNLAKIVNPGVQTNTAEFFAIEECGGNTLSEPLLDSSMRSSALPRYSKSAFDQHEVPDSTKARMECLFPQVENLKQTLFETITQQQYNVEQLYKTTGRCQELARSETFKSITLCVIVLNTVWIGISADNNDEVLLCKARPIFQIMDNLFCTFFTFEILVRFQAFARKCVAFTDGWFAFDSMLVGFMVWETWGMVLLYFPMCSGGGGDSSTPDGAPNTSILRVLRLFRLSRVARATRLLSSFPELLIMVRGLVAGMRSVLAVLCFLGLVIYVFGITFRMTLKDADVGKGVFENVPQAMNSLLLQVLCGPDADLMGQMLEKGLQYYITFLVFIVIAVMVGLNMLTGILVDAVSSVAETAQDESFMREINDAISSLVEALDDDGNGSISDVEFEILVKDPQAMSNFHDLGVDIVSLVDFGRFVFAQCPSGLSCNAFTQMVSQFRGNRTATLQAVTEMRRYVSTEMLLLEQRLVKICKVLGVPA